MFTKLIRFIGLTALVAVMLGGSLQAQDRISRDYNDDDNNNYNNQYRNDEISIDRYLEVELWTNHSDGDFFEGDKIEISFRTNRDAN